MREKGAWRESEVRKEKDMGKGKISLTPQNRHLAGFMELEDEYLVIPPEIVVDGEKRKIGAIGSAAFASCRDLRTLFCWKVSRKSEPEHLKDAEISGIWRSREV